jgi:ABC-type molybdenum transport system ATPase subunit/photorepair protein PhrA
VHQIGPRYDKEIDLRISWADRMRHIYVIGKTGSGKTNLLTRIARQDIAGSSQMRL